jgi:gamma-glutamyltranspeptidase / glutathione hydrolase
MAQLSSRSLRSAVAALVIAAFAVPSGLAAAQKTNKPVLHGQKWVAITGKPLGATAGAMIFQKGGNAVDAACAMLAAVATMWDVLSWGGETQALIYDPIKKKVIGVNALGVAPTGATPELFRKQKLNYPPEYGALAAVTPGTPGGLFAMLAEYGTMSLADVLAPAIALAEGYPIEQGTADSIERNKDKLKQWPYARATMLPHLGKTREAPDPGELFRQPELAGTLKKLVEAEGTALRAGKNRKQAIYAAHERFYKGDIAQELVRGAAEQGGLITMADLAGWKVRFEEPVATTYRGIAVYKLTTWTQGPAMLQALNILEGMDLKAMGYNTTRYIHALYQAMSLAFADRDFYYGDPYSGPEEPIRGLLSKDYARQRAKQLDWTRNNAAIKPGDPYPFQKQANPFKSVLERWGTPQEHTGGPVTTGTHQGPVTSAPPSAAAGGSGAIASASPNQLPLPLDDEYLRTFKAGTTSIQAADDKGWVVSITPSGGWVPAVIAGKTGVGLSQRMQSFVLDASESPFNVVGPGRLPRVTLTPTLALKDGKPFLSFAVQGGDTQDQNLLQFFLNIVEFGMNVQQATEAANIVSYQMRSSFGAHDSRPGKLTVHDTVPPWTRAELTRMGYTLDASPRTSGPINAIYFDREHGTMWGGSSTDGDDYGIAW